MQPQGTDPGRVFGNYLRSERESRRIPLSEVAAVTKIPLRTLESLEDGRWQELPAEVFVRGFVRSYTRTIGLCEQEAMRHYAMVTSPLTPAEDELEDDVEAPDDAHWSQPMSSRRRFEVALFVIIVLILATITLSLLWRRGGANTDIQADSSTPFGASPPTWTISSADSSSSANSSTPC